MSADILRRDTGFRRWLAARPGLWREVGVFDDAALLLVMMAERRALGLPRLEALWAGRPVRSSHRTLHAGVGASLVQAVHEAAR